ncbi:TetR/AcrR family transcriptional regulator [Nocardia sp. CA-128927]|uniref:TetR/AcrR family transcriptional regulator n=1 Tax=Nocardia sp. CA-128927 TaxID=3239975 RepID=UPI003D98E633
MTPLSRRAEKRQDMVAEIKDRARAQLADGGAGELSLRAIARDMRMSSAAIYRYFDSQSALIDALCVDAYTSWSDAVEAAYEQHRDDDPTAQWWAIAQAARQWALSSSEEFALIFGTPIPGHHAVESATGPAAARAMHIFAGVYATAVLTGAADLRRCFIPEPVQFGELGRYLLSMSGSETITDSDTQQLSKVAAVGNNAWASILGFLITELWGNLPRLITNVDDLYHAHLCTVMVGMGFDPDTIPARRPREE